MLKYTILCVLPLIFTTQLLQAEERPAVTIGMVIPLSGANAIWGVDADRSAALLEDDLNAQQSRYQFHLVREDGKCGQGNAAITAAKKLATVDKVRFLVVGCSGEILQIGPYAQSEHIVAVAYAASHPEVKQLGDYVFRTYVDLEDGIKNLSRTISDRKDLPLAILTEENAFTFGIKTMLLQQLAGHISFADDYAIGDADLRTLVLKAKTTKPAAYYLNAATPQTFITLFKQIRDLGIQEQIYAYYNPSDKSVQEALGAKLNGVTFVDVPEVGVSSADFQAFLAKFTARYPAGPSTPFLIRTSYNAVKVLFDAIMAVGPNPEKVKEYLTTYQAPGATGPLHFDANGDVTDLHFVVKTLSLPRR